jgi:glucosamine--fructose-6-phosphate aminotransferase (isomerizing)
MVFLSHCYCSFCYWHREFLIEVLTVLNNRGYDSAGIATMSSIPHSTPAHYQICDGDKADGIELVAQQSAHQAALLQQSSSSSSQTGHTVGIAHTRWATHGGKRKSSTTENKHHCIWFVTINRMMSVCI